MKCRRLGLVAPHEGAWIEIMCAESFCPALIVAPHEGAWIEIDFYGICRRGAGVAPHEGAWIEIMMLRNSDAAR